MGRAVNYNYNYGINTMWTLPWKFQLETDFRIYSRRGYEDEAMNDDNFVWNARLIAVRSVPCRLLLQRNAQKGQEMTG